MFVNKDKCISKRTLKIDYFLGQSVLFVACSHLWPLFNSPHAMHEYTLCPKKRDCLYFRQKLIDFQNSFTIALFVQLAIKWLLNIPPRVNCVATLRNINARKANNNRQQACWWTKYTSEQKCHKWSIRCYTLLNLFLWMFGVLYDMFVFGLFGLASLPFHPQRSNSLQYVYASVWQSHAFGRCSMFLKSVLLTFPLFPCCSLSSKILPVFYENCIFWTGTSS